MTNLSKFHLSSSAAGIRAALPQAYLAGIFISYGVNALLVVYFLAPILGVWFPSWAAYLLAGLGGVAVQYFRCLIVISPQLLPAGRPGLRELFLIHSVAAGMAVWAIAESIHAIRALPGVESSQAWALSLFAAGVCIAGWILEISFVGKLNRLTALEATEQPQLAEKRKPRGEAPPVTLEGLEALGNGHSRH